MSKEDRCKIALATLNNVCRKHKVKLAAEASIEPVGRASRFIFKYLGRFINIKISTRVVVKDA